jgi:hypothetical protein
MTSWGRTIVLLAALAAVSAAGCGPSAATTGPRSTPENPGQRPSEKSSEGGGVSTKPTSRPHDPG